MAEKMARGSMGEGNVAAKPLVLIVEDDPILSLDLAEILKDLNPRSIRSTR